MSNLLIVIASQDFESANHRGLWEEYSKLAGNNVLVLNLPADYVVSKLKKKSYRIMEAKAGIKEISPSLYVLRPLYLVRPEIVHSKCYKSVARSFWNQIEEHIKLSEYNRVSLLIYHPLWVRILHNTKENIKIVYFLYDEVRYYAHSQKINKKKYYLDEYACRNADVVLTMTEHLRETRAALNSNIVVFGNGASISTSIDKTVTPIPKSVAFIGNFRSWIDEQLLKKLVESRQDLLFLFAGPIENEMRSIFDDLLNSFCNTAYLGCFKKENMNHLYKMVSCVIVPYKQNEFMQSTRPIKIVESVLAGTPVVTIPMSGYNESSFIRFATTAKEFSTQINYTLMKGIGIDQEEYCSFCKENTWRKYIW